MITIMALIFAFYCLFSFDNTAISDAFPLSLHDALPISRDRHHDLRNDIVAILSDSGFLVERAHHEVGACQGEINYRFNTLDRKSTRLNSSHVAISYAVFCLKKKI